MPVFKTNRNLHLDNEGVAAAIDAAITAPLANTAVLVAGTVTVADTNITANSVIEVVTTKTLGGTPGALFISAKSVGVSFTISSTSNTDTSTVVYQILAY